MKHILLILLFTGILGVPLAAQKNPAAPDQAREWLLKMNRAYLQARNFSMKIDVQYFNSRIDQKPSVTQAGEVKYAPGRYFCKMMGRIIISNSRCALIVDETEKTIVYMKSLYEKNKQNPAAGLSPEIMIDSMLYKNSKVRLLRAGAANARIEIIPQQDVYEKIELSINSSTYALEEVVYYYKKIDEDAGTPKVIIRYADVRFNAGIPEDDFSEKKYVQKKSGKWFGLGSRAGYKIIDQTNANP